MDHDSLLIITWDEPDKDAKNHIVTIFAGPMVRRGCVTERIDHFRLLRTLLEMYDLPLLGESANAAPITEVWIGKVEGPDCNQNGVRDDLDLANGTSGDENRNAIPDECETRFHRGDPDTDGSIDLTDAVFLLNHLFIGGTTLNCLESADADDSAGIDLADAVLLLNFLFFGNQAPAAPGPTGSACGLDHDAPGSPGDLGCTRYDACSGTVCEPAR